MKSSAPSDKVLLGHIRESIERIREYTGNNQDVFFDSQIVRDAVVPNLQILAESTQRLSDSIKATEQRVPWREIAGFRTVLAHGYSGLDHRYDF